MLNQGNSYPLEWKTTAELTDDQKFVNPEFDVELLQEGIFDVEGASEKFNNTNVVLVQLLISRKTSSYVFKVMIPYIVGNLLVVYALIAPANISKRVGLAVLAVLIDLTIFEYLWQSIGNTIHTPYASKKKLERCLTNLMKNFRSS